MNKKQTKDEKKSIAWKNDVQSLLGRLTINSNKYNVGLILENDYEDFIFWKHIITTAVPTLKPCCVATANFELNTTITKPEGKDYAMKFKDEVNEKLIICRDTDNWLLYGHKDAAYLTKSYIYHTYTYDREAHAAYPKNLQAICNELTFKDFDFEKIVNIYSETVFPFLVYWVHSQSNPELYSDVNERHRYSTWKELGWNFGEDDKIKNSLTCLLLPIEEIDILNIEVQIKTTLKDKIEKWVELIKAKFLEKNDWYTAEIFAQEINEVETKLMGLISKNETFFYLNGHKTVEKFMFPFAEKVINELGKLQKQDIKTRLQDSYKLGNPFMDKIMEKIKADFL